MVFEGLVHVLEERIEVSECVIDEAHIVEPYWTNLGVLDLLDCEEGSFPVTLHGREDSAHNDNPRIRGLKLVRPRMLSRS